MDFWTWLGAKAISKAVGDGFGAEVTGRASAYLVDEARKAVDRDEVPVSHVRLRPGETYTVIARPAPKRAERKLARQKAGLQSRQRALARPTKRQRRSARKLRSAQRRLDRRRLGTRRHASAAAREATRGARFDRLMTPTKQQIATDEQLTTVTESLDSIRARRFEAVRSKRGFAHRPEHVQFFDAVDD